MGLTVPGEKPLRASLWASSLGHSCDRARKGRRACKVLRLWNLNICIEKIDAKWWLAEITFVMRSLPLAPVFQCLYTFTLISTLCWLAEIWQLSWWGATRELNVEFKFQRHSCKLSFSCPTTRAPRRVCLQAAQSKGEKPTWGFRTWPYLCW